MYRTIVAVFFLFAFLSCDKEPGYLRLPGNLTVTAAGQNVDSLIKANKYTALVLYCDHCGKGIPDLYYWNDIVKKNANISPLIIIKSDIPKLIEAYLDIYRVNHPRVLYNFDTLRAMNPIIKSNTVILIDSSYRILHQTADPENTNARWKYIHIYK